MTTPGRPSGPGAGPSLRPDAPDAAGWNDERLDAAFAMHASRVTVPSDLVAATLGRLRPAARPSAWTRLLPAGAALVLVLGLVGGGVALVSRPAGLLGGGSVTFRDGPTPDLRTLDGGEYALDFPASWLAYTAAADPGSGGSIDALLTTQPIEERCGSIMGVDVNCVYEQRLEPGQLRIFVGSGSYRAKTVLDRADIENGTTTRLVVGGMPAILDEFDVAPDDFYQADQSASWAIATPASLVRVIRIEFRARDPEAAAARAAVDALVATFRFTPPATPLPDDPDAAVAAARAALDIQAASFRQGFVPADDPDAQTYLDCLGDVPGEAERMGVRYGPGGALGWFVTVDCSWSVTTDGAGFWRIDADWAWIVEGQRGLWSETFWIGTGGAMVSSSSSGEPLPIGAPTPTASPSPLAASAPALPSEVFGLEVIDVEAAVAVRDRPGDDREIAVSGWYYRSGAIRDCDPLSGVSALFYGPCGVPDAWFETAAGTTDLVIATGQGPSFTSLPGVRAPIVLVGHFDDRRAKGCVVVLETACEDVFWVDTAWVDGDRLPRDWSASTSDEPATGFTHDEAWTRVAGPDDDPMTPLSVGLIPGTMLGAIEPASVGYIAAEPWIWHVTAYEPSSGRVRTFVIPDSVLQHRDGIMSYEIAGDDVLTMALIID